MQLLIGLIGAGLGVVFLTIPLLNTQVFHAVNIQEVIEEGRQGIRATTDCMQRGEFAAARDSARSLIERFRCDSTEIFLADVSRWDSVLALIKAGRDDLPTNLLLSRMDPQEADSVAKIGKGADLGFETRMKIIGALNAMVGDPLFFTGDARTIALDKDRQCRERYERLVAGGVYTPGAEGVSVKKNLSAQEAAMVRGFHAAIVTRLLYPQFLKKDNKRNRDWASEYIVQTAYYFIGASFRNQFENENAIRVYDSLIMLYPLTLYAEELFLQVGTMLFDDGRSDALSGKFDSGKRKIGRALGYLERIEKNREVAAEFPKYRNVEVEPNKYTNLDEAALAKRRMKQKTKVYTLQEAKQDLSGKSDEAEGGNTLEDAVKLIGECYVVIGETDSARAQLKLLLDFFPESDNLDDAQKAIADSYARDGDMALAGKDSTDQNVRRKAARAYELAVKQYQKFVNVYPQSDLISKVYISLGDVYNKLGKADEAARAFAAALELSKESEDKAKIQLEIGSYYYERKQYAKALAAYDVILATFMSTKAASNAQYQIGMCHIALGDTAKGMEAFKTIVEHYKESQFYANAALQVGNHSFTTGDYKQALEYYRKGYNYASTDPQAPLMLLKSGEVWVKFAESEKDPAPKEKNYNEAIKEFQKVVDLYKGSSEADKASCQIAECYMKTGREDAARKAVKEIQSPALVLESIKIIGIDVDNPDDELNYWRGLLRDAGTDEEKSSILSDMAKIYFEGKEDYDSALTLYQQALQLTTEENKQITCKVGIAFVYGAQKKYADALTVLGELTGNIRVPLELRQQLQIQFHETQMSAGEYDKALEGFENFATQNPQHPLAGRAQYQAGQTLALQKKHEEALKKMELVIEKYRDSDVYDKAVLGKGEQMIELGKAREGVTYLEKFLAANRDTLASAANFYFRLGETYGTQLKEEKKAVAAYRTVLDSFPQDRLFSFSAFKLGTLLRDAGDDKGATEAFAKVKREDKGAYRAAQAEIAKILAKTDPEAAIGNYRKIVEQSETAEDSALAMVGIGDVYKLVNKPKEAADAFEAVYQSYHGADTTLLAATVVKWVDALMNSKQYDKAIKTAQIMLERFPTSEYAVNTLYFEASAWLAKKDYGKAREKFMAIIKENKSEQLTEVAYFQKGDCNFFPKNFTAAVRDYEEYLKAYPKGIYRASALYMQGNAYWSLEQFGNAAKKFYEIVTRHGDFRDICSAKNYYAFALNRDNPNRWKESAKYYNEVLKGGGCSAEAKKFAREQVEALMSTH